MQVDKELIGSLPTEDLTEIHHSISQEIYRRENSAGMDSYAAPHVWNLVAKTIRDNYLTTRENSTQKLAYNSALTDLALVFAHRFQEDQGFDPITWLDKCSPDPELYPFSELWDG